jgi:hypothetical protein
MAGSDPGRQTATATFNELTVGALEAFLAPASAGDYIAIQAFVRPAAGTDAALQELRLKLRDRYGLATTTGYGPRYLHSTGQFHKGGPNTGYFIQFVSTPAADLPIPDEPGSSEAQTTFAVLKEAQAQGDAQALLNARRRIIRFQVSSDAERDLERLLEGMNPEKIGGLVTMA